MVKATTREDVLSWIRIEINKEEIKQSITLTLKQRVAFAESLLEPDMRSTIEDNLAEWSLDKS